MTTFQVSAGDVRRAELVRRVRQFTHRHVEVGSKRSFRKRVIPVSGPPRLVSAAGRYRGMGWLPAELLVPERLPKEARLPVGYVLGYYGVAKALFSGYRFSPISSECGWSPGLPWANDVVPPVSAPDRPVTDENFVALRTQGPNPFALRLSSPDPNLGDVGSATMYEADFSGLLAGLGPPLRARFLLDAGGRLCPSAIVEGNHVHRPGSHSWEGAKHLVNAVDARATVFINHLLFTHLVVGQAYALAAWRLPNWHPIRPLCDFFTYGTLAVNDVAYRSLLSSSSYFVMSNFISRTSARTMIDNAMKHFRFNQWLPISDLAERGVADLAGYAYGQDAKLVWPALEDLVRGHLADLQLDDNDVASDLDLMEWHLALRRVLPANAQVPPLGGLDSLVSLLTAMIYNNVIHEVCGDFSPLVAWGSAQDRQSVNFDQYLAARANGSDIPQPRASDVLLTDQGAVASTANVGGNNLLDLNVGRVVDDPQLERSLVEMQRRLGDLGVEIDRRNAERKRPFTALEPRRWEASISY